MNKPRYIRWALTVGLVIGAYTETGIFTALSLFLVFVAIELLCKTLVAVLKK